MRCSWLVCCTLYTVRTYTPMHHCPHSICVQLHVACLFPLHLLYVSNSNDHCSRKPAPELLSTKHACVCHICGGHDCASRTYLLAMVQGRLWSELLLLVLTQALPGSTFDTLAVGMLCITQLRTDQQFVDFVSFCRQGCILW